MLVFTRNVGQKFLIDSDVKIIILNAFRGRVKIGISAPKEIAVHREEVYARIQDELLLQSQLSSYENHDLTSKKLW